VHLTDGFEEFVTVVEEGSVSAAARKLGQPRATVSRRLARLEEDLGVRLIHRSTRSMTLTQAGQAFFARARRVVSEARVARDEVALLDGVPRGLLRLSMPPTLDTDGVMGPMLTSFSEKWPEVSLEVFSEARYVDLAAEGFDVAMRGGPPREDGYISRTIWRSRVRAVASPEYVARHGEPQTLADLAEHNCIVGFGGDQAPTRQWPTFGGSPVRVAGRVASNDLLLRQRFALSHRGITLLPDEVTRELVDEGRLVVVLPDLVGAKSVVRLVFVERKMMEPKVRAFVDHVVEWTAQRDVRGRTVKGGA